jgi:hypothetical protein
MEEGVVDHRYGRYVNNNLTDYHIPVNADVPDIEVIFIDKPDPILSPLGVKGLGEIGLIGFTAAVANAVYHATGTRVRSLPITADKLLDPNQYKFIQKTTAKGSLNFLVMISMASDRYIAVIDPLVMVNLTLH